MKRGREAGRSAVPSGVLATATLVAGSLRALTPLRDRGRTAQTLREAHDDLEQRVAERTAALEALSRRISSILESAGEGIWGVDRDGRTVFANRAAAELTGYSIEELLVPRLHDTLQHTHPDGRPYPVEESPVWRSVRDGSVHEVSDEVYFRKDGTSFPVEYTSTPVREGGELRGAVVVFRDVTERRRALRALSQSEERTRQILATAHDAFVSVDAGGRIIDWNAAAEEIFGWRRSEAIGRTFADTLIPPAPLDGLWDREEQDVIDRRVELGALRRDGSQFPVELTISPLLLDDGPVYNVFVRDISDRRQAQLELQRERDFLDAVLESLTDGVVACGPDGVLTLFNRAARELLGAKKALPPERWASHYGVLRPDGKAQMSPEEMPLTRALRGERVRDAEVLIAQEERPLRRLLCNGQPIEDSRGQVLGALVTTHDVTERRHAEERLVHQALHDSLTGLPNRALLLDRLRNALAGARRDGSVVAVLVADLDHFKLVNDSFGHDAGDELLVALAARLDERLRAEDTVGRPCADTVARLGGDEFVVLCGGLKSERDAIRIAERIDEAVRGPFSLGGEQEFPAASIGVALSSGAETAECLLRDADAAMYRAKERGRGRYELFDEAIRVRVVDRMQRERELRRAIEQGQLRVHYQPIVSLADHRIVATEALVRWEHPERGLLPPAEFMELAEDSGLVVPLGRWVLREACHQIARWEGAFGCQLDLSVSVNVSARQLRDAQIAGEVEQAVSAAGIDPAHLALEITETVLMEESEAPVAVLEALGRMGTRLVLDDFGIGYSSLSYLRRLPLDVLKLDRSFVAPLGRGDDGRDIAAAVVQMAHALDMVIVAEGVDTEAQRLSVEALGFDLAQGYLFAHPLSAVAMTDLIATVLGARGSPAGLPLPPPVLAG